MVRAAACSKCIREPAASNLIACKTFTPLTLEYPPRFGLAQAQPVDIYSRVLHRFGTAFTPFQAYYTPLVTHCPWYPLLIHLPVLRVPIICV
jgi:hypothetical protein